jgi:hypothetical protein
MPSNERSGCLLSANFCLRKWLTPQIVAIDHQQIECTSDGRVIGSAARQSVETWNTLLVETNNLGIHNYADFDACCCFHNTGNRAILQS